MTIIEPWDPGILGLSEPSLAACFAAVVEMQSLLVKTVDARQNVALLCLYGWDISCLPSTEVQAKEIDRLWHARTMKGSELPGHREWFEQEIGSIITQRRQFFPTLESLIISAAIAVVDASRDRLTVEHADGLERFDLPRVGRRELADGLGRRIKVIWEDAQELDYWLETVPKAELERCREAVIRTCGLWRVRLAKLRELASELHQMQVEASAKRVTAEWGYIADEAETKISAAQQAVAATRAKKP